MIVRLALGSAGPRIDGVSRPGDDHGRRDDRRQRGLRWALVVVSKDLYCESPAADWARDIATASVLEARWRGRRYTASGTLARCVADAGLRGLLVPEEALRGSGRLLRLASARFRLVGRLRLIVAKIAVGGLLAAAIGMFAVASGAAVEGKASLSRAEAVRADRVTRTATLVGLRDEVARLTVGNAGQPPALPGSLVSALVSSLAPAERIISIATDGYDTTIVAEGSLPLVSRIDSLERLETTGHTVTERGGSSVVTVRARQSGDAR